MKMILEKNIKQFIIIMIFKKKSTVNLNIEQEYFDLLVEWGELENKTSEIIRKSWRSSSRSSSLLYFLY